MYHGITLIYNAVMVGQVNSVGSVYIRTIAWFLVLYSLQARLYLSSSFVNFSNWSSRNSTHCVTLSASLDCSSWNIN